MRPANRGARFKTVSLVVNLNRATEPSHLPRRVQVHWAALRYLLLFEAMLRSDHLSEAQIRDRQSGRLQILTYAALLRHLYRPLIEGARDGLVRELEGKVVKKVLAAIDQTVEEHTRAEGGLGHS